IVLSCLFFFFSSRRRHTRLQGDWSSDVCSSDADGSVPATPRVSHAQGGAQVYGDAEGEALSEERNTAARSSDSLMRAAPEQDAAPQSRSYQVATVVGLLALAVLTLFFKQDIGFVSITIGLVLTLMAPNLQKRALGQVSWPEIMLIVGVSRSEERRVGKECRSRW